MDHLAVDIQNRLAGKCLPAVWTVDHSASLVVEVGRMLRQLDWMLRQLGLWHNGHPRRQGPVGEEGVAPAAAAHSLQADSRGQLRHLGLLHRMLRQLGRDADSLRQLGGQDRGLGQHWVGESRDGLGGQGCRRRRQGQGHLGQGYGKLLYHSCGNSWLVVVVRGRSCAITFDRVSLERREGRSGPGLGVP